MKDATSRTEAQAAASARADAYPDVQDERDDGVVVQLGHECSEVVFPDTCLGCLTWERYWLREREDVNAANDEEWWA